ncbi:MAG: cell wall hydrolase, partial [Sphingopyxis sp.]|nr:cell wall hydrolase [Sphingopyxis sp.]
MTRMSALDAAGRDAPWAAQGVRAVPVRPVANRPETAGAADRQSVPTVPFAPIASASSTASAAAKPDAAATAEQFAAHLRSGAMPVHSPVDAAPVKTAAQRFAAKGRRGWAYGGLIVATGAVLLFASVRVLGNSGGYSVSVPVNFVAFTPEQLAEANMDYFAAARERDPDLPDPTAIPVLAEVTPDSATAAPALTPAQIRMEAFTGPPAPRTVFRGATAIDTARAHYCLTAALYYEAASETDDGMRGVAQVVLNRVRHPSFPASVCGVVFQGSQRAGVCQFTFACDGAMARAPNRAGWQRASRIAAEALAGRVFAPVGLASHYHTQAVWPSWGRSLAMTNIIGAHIFHRWRGRWGTPAAFTQRYAGREPPPGPYLPISAQLAARAGRGVVAVPLPGATAVAPLPGAMDAALANAGRTIAGGRCRCTRGDSSRTQCAHRYGSGDAPWIDAARVCQRPCACAPNAELCRSAPERVRHGA